MESTRARALRRALAITLTLAACGSAQAEPPDPDHPASTPEHGPVPERPPALSCTHDGCTWNSAYQVIDGYKLSHNHGEPWSVPWTVETSEAPAGTVVRVRACVGGAPFANDRCSDAAEVVVPQPPTVPAIIRAAFAAVGASAGTQDFAVSVARCESGLNPHATNGQYLGLFQMGHYHYWRFDGQPWSDPEVNARAAAGLWADSGWGPWECA